MYWQLLRVKQRETEAESIKEKSAFSRVAGIRLRESQVAILEAPNQSPHNPDFRQRQTRKLPFTLPLKSDRAALGWASPCYAPRPFLHLGYA